MGQQTVNLLLEFAVNLVQHLKANQMIAYFEFVPVLQELLIDGLPVEQSAVGRLQIVQAIAGFAGGFIALGRDPRMKARSTRVVNADVGFQRATHSYLFTVQWNRDREQFSAQKNQRRARSEERRV